MNRRQFLIASLASPFACARPLLAGDSDRVFIADMHIHLFFFGPKSAAKSSLARSMADGRATLVSWSLVGDGPWLDVGRGAVTQRGSPGPGEARAWFDEELARIKSYLAKEKLKIVKTPEDVARAVEGEPHIVLAVEGATFLDDDMSGLDRAYEQGIRHLQLVHYIRNPIGDFQTARPEHNGLSDYGRKVIENCNRLGILIDLAHCTGEVVEEALAVSTQPMVWSHSSVARSGKPHWSMTLWQARQLSLESAKSIAAKGGVVGLWALRADVGGSIEAYADRMSEMADWLGEDHVAFGTDMNAISKPAVAGFADLQRVVAHWRHKGMPAARIRKLAMDNYARVLGQALAASQTPQAR